MVIALSDPRRRLRTTGINVGGRGLHIRLRQTDDPQTSADPSYDVRRASIADPRAVGSIFTPRSRYLPCHTGGDTWGRAPQLLLVAGHSQRWEEYSLQHEPLSPRGYQTRSLCAHLDPHICHRQWCRSPYFSKYSWTDQAVIASCHSEEGTPSGFRVKPAIETCSCTYNVTVLLWPSWVPRHRPGRAAQRPHPRRTGRTDWRQFSACSDWPPSADSRH